MSILAHPITMPLVNKVDELCADYDVASATGTILSAIEMIRDNGGADSEGFEVEFRITKDGYCFLIPEDVTVEQFEMDFQHALDVIIDDLEDSREDFIL